MHNLYGQRSHEIPMQITISGIEHLYISIHLCPVCYCAPCGIYKLYHRPYIPLKIQQIDVWTLITEWMETFISYGMFANSPSEHYTY